MAASGRDETWSDLVMVSEIDDLGDDVENGMKKSGLNGLIDLVRYGQVVCWAVEGMGL